MSTKKHKLVLVGAGEFSEIAYEYFTYDSDYEVVGFSVERDYLDGETMHGLPLVAFEDVENHFPPSDVAVFVAVPASGLNSVRKKLYMLAKEKGFSIASYISSRAFVWRNAEIGENCFIFEDNTVQPFVTIGNNVILWSGNHIGHRTVIQDHCFISSHAVISGYCTIGESSFIGVNSTFNDHIEVADHCIVASGALVSKSLKTPDRVYTGSPAAEMPRLKASKIKL